MCDGTFLSDLFGHAIQFPACGGDAAVNVLLLGGVHVRKRFPQLPAGAAQNGGGHLQIALQLRPSARHGPALRFEKQFRRGENALAHDR